MDGLFYHCSHTYTFHPLLFDFTLLSVVAMYGQPHALITIALPLHAFVILLS